MIQKIRKFITIALASATLLAPSLATVAVSTGRAAADIPGAVCQGTNDATGSGLGNGCGNSGLDGNASGLGDIAQKVVNIFSIIVGIVAVIMIIYGGFRYITSGGDSGSVGNAKNTLIYAIVGLIIVVLAQVIVHFVINTTSGSVTTN